MGKYLAMAHAVLGSAFLGAIFTSNPFKHGAAPERLIAVFILVGAMFVGAIAWAQIHQITGKK